MATEGRRWQDRVKMLLTAMAVPAPNRTSFSFVLEPRVKYLLLACAHARFRTPNLAFFCFILVRCSLPFSCAFCCWRRACTRTRPTSSRSWASSSPALTAERPWDWTLPSPRRLTAAAAEGGRYGISRRTRCRTGTLCCSGSRCAQRGNMVSAVEAFTSRALLCA